MAEVWTDEKKLYIKASTATEVRILDDAEQKKLIKKITGVTFEGADITWEASK